VQLEQRDVASRFLDRFPDPTWSLDRDGLLVGWNTAAENVFGRTAAEVLGTPVVGVLGQVPPTTGPVELHDSLGRLVHGAVVTWSVDEVRHTALRVSTGDAGVVSRRLLEGLLEHVSDAIVTVDAEGLVLSLNKGAEKLYGVTAHDVAGRHARTLVRSAGPSADHDAMRTALVAGEPWYGVEVQITTHAGREIVVDSAATAVLDPGGAYVGAILVSRDITPVRELEQSLRAATRALRDRASQIAKATHRDSLTGVAARSLLQERLAAALTAAAENDEPVWVLASDLDGFRAVNDSYGLATGDAVLIAFAAHLRAALPPSATAGRLGADEFAVVLPGLDEEGAARLARAVTGWTPPTPLPTRGRRGDDPDVGVTVAVVRATPLECRSPFDTGVRSLLQRAEDAVAAAKRPTP
jgi:diguanylate cyclase (GGDEF)-like protein/PAS domain S-box-containing protein